MAVWSTSCPTLAGPSSGPTMSSHRQKRCVDMKSMPFTTGLLPLVNAATRAAKSTATFEVGPTASGLIPVVRIGRGWNLDRHSVLSVRWITERQGSKPNRFLTCDNTVFPKYKACPKSRHRSKRPDNSPSGILAVPTISEQLLRRVSPKSTTLGYSSAASPKHVRYFISLSSARNDRAKITGK